MNMNRHLRVRFQSTVKFYSYLKSNHFYLVAVNAVFQGLRTFLIKIALYTNFDFTLTHSRQWLYQRLSDRALPARRKAVRNWRGNFGSPQINHRWPL